MDMNYVKVLCNLCHHNKKPIPLQDCYIFGLGCTKIKIYLQYQDINGIPLTPYFTGYDKVNVPIENNSPYN